MEDLTDIHEILERPIELIIRQQPVHSRMCGIGERVDRRPIDPPPVVQLKINSLSGESLFALSSYLFLVAVLIPVNNDEENESINDENNIIINNESNIIINNENNIIINNENNIIINNNSNNNNNLDILLHGKLTVGRTVSSLYILKDLDDTEGGFFVFSDISVRAEGTYKLRMCLFDIIDGTVRYNTSVLTDPFTVYSAKSFPGMYRSCPLVQNFARQGLKIRIRRESGPRPARYSSNKKKVVRSIKSSTESSSSSSSSIQTLSTLAGTGTSSAGTSSAETQTTPTTFLSNQEQFSDNVSWNMPVSPPKRRRLSLSYLLDTTDSGNNSMDTSL